jgi:prepilin-type N-terminal cleavage/methylation domain-containing protein
MSPSGSAAARGKGGFTLLEMLLVLGLMAMMAALILPRIAVQIDQAAAHSEFLKFQQQVMDLRRQSFHEGQGLRIVATGELADDPDADPPLAQVQLAPGWSYRLSAPIDIDAGGGCSPAEVDLIRSDKVILHLQGSGPSCRFFRAVG